MLKIEHKAFWTLRKKVIIGYSLVLCLIIAVIIWSLINMVRLGKAAEAILKENYKSILAAENMIDSLERQDSAILLFLLDYPDKAIKQFKENENNFLLWLGRAKDNITIEGEEQIIEGIDNGYIQYLIDFSNLQTIAHSDSAQATELYHQTVLPTFVSIRKECIELREINQNTMFEASNKANNVSNRAFWSVFTIGLASVVVGVGFSFLLAGLIVKPIHQIIAAAKKISEGDYDVEVKSKSHDEIGMMAKDFNQMVQKLKAYRDLNLKQILSEKHKSEAIIGSIDDGLIVINSELKIEDINPAAAKIFDKKPNEIKGYHLLEITKDEKLFNYAKKSFTFEIAVVSEDTEANVLTINKGQSQQHYSYSATPVFAGEESVISMVLLLRDITRLKELDRLKSEFVMAASHELKTPLTSIGMSISLLKEKLINKLDSKESELLNVADEEVLRLKALISDLLDISRIEAGKMPLDFDSITVKLICEKAVSLLKKQADEKNIELSYNVPTDLPNIKADANKITWVLTNLIANSLRYTDANGYIKLSATSVGSQIHISVEDNGSGIPYEYQSRIFDKFVQVKTEKALGGSGLGLAICKEIVRAHGGTIWVDSQPGKGSTFTFTVPVAS
ncbi:MAG: PAS domain-containing sensor histidine kinase [Planctomycetes bacterium GWF2_41_51]|nr:MAG: PAS domain-containing sensor histidine kinase [Planctomycetes bacterium GWF2_41_51]HBG26497.1 PAS domain-containing sensor histidine kinase [Phycisphaerales bacterium]